jgi:hypothetical protein
MKHPYNAASWCLVLASLLLISWRVYWMNVHEIGAHAYPPYIPHIDGPISVRTLFASACSLIACYGDVQELQDLPVKGR